MRSGKRKRKTKVDHRNDTEEFAFIDPHTPPVSSISTTQREHLINISKWHIDDNRVSGSSSVASYAVAIPRTETHMNLNSETNQYDYSTIYQAFDNIGEPAESTEDQVNDKDQADHSTNAWLNQIDLFLAELLHLDGRGEQQSKLLCRCANGEPCYRCRDCLGGPLCCADCIMAKHKSNPFHHIEWWNGTFFERISLKSLGSRIQLGHPTSETCLLPSPVPGDNFVIIDTTGIHEVGLDFCGCGTGGTEVQQLLRSRLYPATVQKPNTAATFRSLHQFQLLNFESKCTVYEFFQTLARLSDNTGLHKTKDRYKELLHIVRQWRHLKMLKRSGYGQLSSDVTAKQPSLGLLCPACPQPGINLPLGWEHAPKEESWLYTLFLALDANFRMSRKGVSSADRDPSLSQGQGYFVDGDGLSAHLAAHGGKRQEPSTCVAHNAVNTADTRDTRGLAVTGVGTVDCARHDIKRPNSTGDLQKGERYVNMDYFFYSGLKSSGVKSIVVSYDIACQWSKNFPSRMKDAFPEDWPINTSDVDLQFVVPKFHLPAHVESCRLDRSLNYLKHVGRTDGEAPERGWSNINGLSNSTREMGPGSRQDTIDDHFGDWNWKKIVGFGSGLLRKLKIAIGQKAKQLQAWEDLSAILDPQDIATWKAEVEAWENDSSQPNPFKPRLNDFTEADVRLQLAQEDAQGLKVMGPSAAIDTGPGSMVQQGLELEDQLHKLLEEEKSLGLHPTALQQAQLLEKRNTFFRRLSMWRDTQAYYIPAITTLQSTVDDNEPVDFNGPLDRVKLLFPSTIGTNISWDQQLGSYEWLLREARARDSISKMRQFLAMTDFLWKRKRAHSRGVSQNTRSLSGINKVIKKTQAAAARYRMAHASLSALAPLLGKGDHWTQEFRMLKTEDIKGLPVDGLGEGTRQLSWIWLAPGAADPNEVQPKTIDALRIQWCRVRARAMRWSEEVLLLQEEMRRVLAFLRWDARSWESRATTARSHNDLLVSEGLMAYATRQASLKTALSKQFEKQWADVALQVTGKGSVNAQRTSGNMGPGSGETVALTTLTDGTT